MKRALLTGIGGQDSSFLAELLLEKDYKVFGTYRPVDNLENVQHLEGRITRLQADLKRNA